VIQRKLVSGKNAALLALAILQFQIAAFAQEVCRDPAGRFASIEGRVQIRGDNQEAWRAAKPADRLCKGDSIRVGEKSRAAVVLVNEAVLRLDQNTTMRLVNISGKKEERSLIEMAQGAIKSFIRKPRLLQVNTPYLNGSVEGTEFQVSVAENAASILVLEGRILASNDQGKVTINPGEIAEAQAGAAPTSRLLVKPRDAVQWTLYYPPIQATSGDVPTNLEALDKVAESDRDAAWHINRASLLLSVGRQDEALASIDAALKLDPKAVRTRPWLQSTLRSNSIPRPVRPTPCAPSSIPSVMNGRRHWPKPKKASRLPTPRPPASPFPTPSKRISNLTLHATPCLSRCRKIRTTPWHGHA